MATVIPISELTNYKEVLEKVTGGNPVYLSIDGNNKYVIRDMDDEKEHEQTKAMLTLLLKLNEGRVSGSSSGYINIDDVRKHFGIKSH